MDEATIKNFRLAATKAGMQSPHKYPLVHCHAIITWCARKIKPKPEVGANHAKNRRAACTGTKIGVAWTGRPS